MIWLTKIEKSESNNQIYFTVQIDARHANIRDSKKKGLIQGNLDKRIASLAAAVTCGRDLDPVVQEFKKYLSEGLFRRFLDAVAVNNFLYELKTAMKLLKENIVLAGYKTSYDYKNYESGN